jgi:phosphoribosylanthranilate isomerase
LYSEKDVKIKICGVTSVEDAQLVAQAGADYIGVNHVNASPRRLSLEKARQISEQSTLPVVSLFFNWEAEQIQEAIATLHPHAIQLVGQETPSLIETLKRTTDCEVWKSVHLPPQEMGEVNITEYQDMVNSLVDAGIDAIIIDTVVGSTREDRRYGGTGQVSNWAVASKLVETIPVRCFLAGGIKPENVRQAIEQVNPYGVDISSGVESAPGKKDPEKLNQLVTAARKPIRINR